MYKIIAVVVVAVVALIVVFTQVDPNLNNGNNASNVVSVYEDEDMVKVVLTGQVVYPGSYSISSSSTISELVDKAGGFLESADQNAILLDTEIGTRTEIYIPIKSTFQTECEIEAEKEKVNINEATASQIATLDAVGDTLAERIVKYREENGPFLALEDLKNVSGIGEAIFSKIRDYIRLKWLFSLY